MTKIEVEVCNKIWDIAKISPEHGNALMDILGCKLYDDVCRIATAKEVNLQEAYRNYNGL